MVTPWGASQETAALADGIVTVTTAGHGGIHLSAERWALMPTAWRTTPYSDGGWYEEDCDWALVALRFPAAFTSRQVADAHRIAQACYPAAYAAGLAVLGMVAR